MASPKKPDPKKKKISPAKSRKGTAKQPPKKKPSTKKPASPPLLRRFIFLCLHLTAIGIVLGLFMLAYYAHDLPDLDKKLEGTEEKHAITLLSDNGTPLLAQGKWRGSHVDASELPSYFIDALIATEDRRFFTHNGIDFWGLARAMATNVKAGSIVQGGSTLTQQLAKNLFLSPDRTIKRKIQEVMLALWLEHHFDKEAILTLYLNRVYFGAGAYGIDAAAHRYFSKPATKLTIGESAMLVGLLKAPSKYSPATNPERAKARANQVLLNMKNAGLASDRMIELAKDYPAQSFDYGADMLSGRYFSDWIFGQLPELIGHPEDDIRIRTTLDIQLQQHCHMALNTMLETHGRERNVSQGAIVLMSPDGAIRCMAGGKSYKKSQYNRVTQAERQPGSAFKLFVYLSALEAGWSANHRIEDEPITIDGWSPDNYSHKYRGTISLTEALAHSVNTVAVQLSEWTGRQHVANMARRLGVVSDIPTHPSMALGVNELTLLELTTAYAHLARNGHSVWPYGIDNIARNDEQSKDTIYRRLSSAPGRVLSPNVVQHMHHMLRETVRIGTGRRAQIPGYQIAGKTGTSQSYRDAWFIGYTPHYVAGVWLGNDNNSPMDHVTGGSLPAQLWRDVMTAAHKDIKPYQHSAPTLPEEEQPLPWLDDETQTLEPQPQQGPSGRPGNWFDQLFDLVPTEVDVEYDYPKPERN